MQILTGRNRILSFKMRIARKQERGLFNRSLKKCTHLKQHMLGTYRLSLFNTVFISSVLIFDRFIVLNPIQIQVLNDSLENCLKQCRHPTFNTIHHEPNGPSNDLVIFFNSCTDQPPKVLPCSVCSLVNYPPIIY